MHERSMTLLSTLAALTLAVAGLAARGSVPDSIVSFNNTGAFRDGLYQAKLHAEQGKRPHIASGRWAARTDRIAFVAGYEEGRRLFAQAHPEKQRQTRSMELAGF